MTDPSRDADERSTARPGGPRRPATLQGIGTAEELLAAEASAAESDRERQVRSLAGLAAESHFAMASPASGPLPEPARDADASLQEETSEANEKRKPATITLGPARRAAHNFDTVRRPTAGNEERAGAKSSRRARRTKATRKQRTNSGLPRGGVVEENAPVLDRLQRLSDGEFIVSSERQGPAEARTDEAPAGKGPATNTPPTKPPPPAPRADLPRAGPQRRERADEKTQRHVYDDRDLASSAKPTGRSGPDHPVVDASAPITAGAWRSAVVDTNGTEGEPSQNAAASATASQPDIAGASAAGAKAAEAKTAPPAASARLGKPRKLGPEATVSAGLRAEDDTPILALNSGSAALPGTPATPSHPVPRSESGIARWLPAFLASALGAFIAVAFYWTAFDAGATSRETVATPPPADVTPPPLPAAAPAPPPEPETAPAPVAEPAPSEAGPLDLGEIPAAIAALSGLERQQLAQDLRIRARSLNRTRQYRRAEQIWRLSLQHDPTNAPAAHGLAETLLATDQDEGAMSWAMRATELDPDDAEHAELLGDALLAANEIEGAIEAYRRALVIDPDSRGARIRLSRARRRLAAAP